MATEAESPFGMPWAYAAMLAAALLVTLVVVVIVVGGKRIRTRHQALLVAALMGAAAWTFFRVGAPVTVAIAADPQGAECVVNALGENPGRSVQWDTRCGKAFTRHLVVTTGPTVAGVAFCLAMGAWLVRQRRSSVPAA